MNTEGTVVCCLSQGDNRSIILNENTKELRKGLGATAHPVSILSGLASSAHSTEKLLTSAKNIPEGKSSSQDNRK